MVATPRGPETWSENSIGASGRGNRGTRPATGGALPGSGGGRDAAVDGLGIVLMPSFIVYREIERGALVPLLTEYRYSQLAAYTIYPQTRHLSQRVRAFVDFLVKRFEGMPYWDRCLKNSKNIS